MELARWSALGLLAAAAIAVPSHAGPAADSSSNADSSAKAKQGVKASVKRGTLRITGNRRANSITLRLKRRARRTLQVDVRSNGTADFAFNRRSFKRIVVKGAGGSDTLRVNERNGSFARAERTTLDGGAGNDRLSAGRARETLRGGPGDDSITTNGSDAVAGGTGTDLVRFDGSAGADVIGVGANGALVRLTRDVGNVGIDASGVERLAVIPLAGADTVNLGNLTGTGVLDASLSLATTASGTDGDGAADTLAVSATDAGESLTPSRGPGTLAVGGLPWAVSASGVDATGDRLTLNGLGGSDTLLLNGTDAGEGFELAASGALLRATTAGWPVESDDVESVVVNALGGGDTVSVGNLGGTDIGQATLDLGVTSGGPADGQVDSVEVSATDAADNVTLSGSPSGIGVTGLAAGTSVRGLDATDRLSVNGLAGADALNASALGANLVALTLRGGPDADTLTGTPGDDSFRSDPGDGSDVVEGGAGADTLDVNGADAAETFQVSTAGPRALVSRNVDSATIDSDAVEAARNHAGRGRRQRERRAPRGRGPDPGWRGAGGRRRRRRSVRRRGG